MPDALPTRDALLAMRPGDTLSVALTPWENAKALRVKLCGLAHRAWGRGCYTTHTEDATIVLRRCAPPAEGVEATRTPAPTPVPAEAPQATGEPYLSRAQAAAYCRQHGLAHITTETLRHAASRTGGPAYYRFGRFAYYRASDLDQWMDAARRAVTPRAA